MKVCANKFQHVSAFPGYGRERCPCGQAYIRKQGYPDYRPAPGKNVIVNTNLK